MLEDRKKEISRMEMKKYEKIKLEKHLKFVKSRYYRLQQHYKLEMEGYQTEMRLMRGELNKIINRVK